MTNLGPLTAMKVTAEHLRRNAYLYVRQSTLRQVLTNTESTHRQYDLRGRAIALGWTAEQVVVIDTDQGQSGASATDRDGFQRLVAEVSMGRAGIVLGLEVSRLARDNADWHRLLEICALSGTLILDEDGLYDPCNFNDRLLLGLKGTMSEALSGRPDNASYADPGVMPTRAGEALAATGCGRGWSA
jgi:DNA invertase Pin-like site-specific DNA recombinase